MELLTLDCFGTVIVCVKLNAFRSQLVLGLLFSLSYTWNRSLAGILPWLLIRFVLWKGFSTLNLVRYSVRLVLAWKFFSVFHVVSSKSYAFAWKPEALVPFL